MKNCTLLLLTLLLKAYCSAQSTQRAEEAILSVLNMQQQAWNHGDLHAFMEGYWKSDNLTFVGANGLILGWDAVLSRYLRAYPDRESMGHLTFTVFRLNVLGRDHAVLIGKWKLTRSGDEPEGFFTLVWRKIGGKWVIVADHTS